MGLIYTVSKQGKLLTFLISRHFNIIELIQQIQTWMSEQVLLTVKHSSSPVWSAKAGDDNSCVTFPF